MNCYLDVLITHNEYINTFKSRISCQKGPTRHAYAWQIGPFWQDTLEMFHDNKVNSLITCITESKMFMIHGYLNEITQQQSDAITWTNDFSWYLLQQFIKWEFLQTSYAVIYQ